MKPEAQSPKPKAAFSYQGNYPVIPLLWQYYFGTGSIEGKTIG